MSVTNADLETERELLEQLVATEGWKSYSSKWQKLLHECATQLKAQTVENREWFAGLVTGYERMLTHPAKRIEFIKDELVKRDKAAHAIN
mgnify:FL=1